jgi:hypothetical protein
MSGFYPVRPFVPGFEMGTGTYGFKLISLLGRESDADLDVVVASEEARQ